MFRIHSYYLAKILFKLRLPSFHHCRIDKTSNISAGSVLADVSMGKYSYTGGDVYITDAVIGNFCSIGVNAHIGGGYHPFDTVSTSPVFLRGGNFLRKNFAQIAYDSSSTVYIGNDVWIGDNAYIKAGVHIGDGAVIGAHAVVTKDVAPYAIMVGVPAHAIRYRFDETTIKKLLIIKWWNWPDDKLEKYGQYFANPEDLFKKVDGQ